MIPGHKSTCATAGDSPPQKRKLYNVAEKRTKAEKTLRQRDRPGTNAEPEEIASERRQGALRSGEDRRKINLPAAPGSPVRSGVDRRTVDRRSKSRA